MKLKFENVDVEQCLRSVMERNTKHYQSDFEYDVGSMERIAQTKHPERTPLCWMSRPSGTWCFRERDVFIRDSDAFYTWQFYKDTRDTILAYTVEITGMEGAASEQEYRHNFIPGVFENHLDQMIAAEKRSVTHFLKEAAANAPHPALNKKTKEHPQR